MFLIFIIISACSSKKDNTNEIPNTATPITWDKFSFGADLSYVNEIEDFGGKYKDSSLTDPFIIFKKYGCNTIRVRLWHNPSWKKSITGGKMYSDFNDVKKTISRAKAAGMAVNLNLHYSDDWADPQKQDLPEAWKNLTFNVLQDSIYRYTSEVLNSLAKENLIPEMIQVGNENNIGVLHPHGKITGNNFENFGKLINNGIKAVRDFSKTAAIKPKIILHVAQMQHAEWWVKGITSSGNLTDFDIIGISHYSKWTEVHSMSGIAAIIQNLKNTYGRKVMIVETAYPWTNQNADTYNNIIDGNVGESGYTVSKSEQLRYLKDLTQTVISAGGSGVQYWEPAWITSNMKDRWGKGSSWENCALFDFQGNAIEGIKFMNQTYKF